jgi:hypothetical protein
MAKDLAALVVATTSFDTVLKGVSVNVRQGELLEADDSIVSHFPQFFGPPKVRARSGTPVDQAPVEQATAAPGEKRGI